MKNIKLSPAIVIFVCTVSIFTGRSAFKKDDVSAEQIKANPIATEINFTSPTPPEKKSTITSVNITESEKIEENTTYLEETEPTLMVSQTQTETGYYFPVKLTIPSISLNARIVESERTGDGGMDVPPDDSTIGWWKYGTKPGEIGSAVLAGHYSIESGAPGVFYNLSQIAVGDSITVDLSDGRILTYEVLMLKIYKREEFPLDDFFISNDLKRLNLITCAGSYVKSIHDFTHRLAVYSVLK